MIKSKKPVKRGVVRAVRRGMIEHQIADFMNRAKRMSKQQLIDHMALINRPDNKTYIISKRFLNRIYGMSEQDIQNAIQKSRDEYKFRQDLKLYYIGKLSPEDVISKWKSKGIETKSDVDMMVTKDIYELTGNYNTPKKIKEHYVPPANPFPTVKGLSFETTKRDQLPKPQSDTVMASTPTGQRSFIVNGYSLYNVYRNFKQYLEKEVRSGNISEQMKQSYLTSYLLDIADSRPEFAAHIAYVLAGNNINDDMNKIESKFRPRKNKEGEIIDPGLKDAFINMMRMYKLQKSRNPEYQRKFQERLQNIDRNAKFKFANESLPDHMKVVEKFKKEKYLNMDPEIIDRVENTDYGRQDRKRKRSKIVPKRKVKKSIKRVVKKTIKRKPIKCRCK